MDFFGRFVAVGFTPFCSFGLSCWFWLVVGVGRPSNFGPRPTGLDLLGIGEFVLLLVLLWSFFLRVPPSPGPTRMPAVRVSAQSRTLTIRGDRKLREFSQAVVLEDILENLKEHHVCSVQFLLGGEIRITFESALDRDAVLCRGPLELKGVRCRFLEGGPPTTLVHVLYLPFEQSNDAVRLALAQYGEVKNVRMQHFPGHPGVATGTRLVSVLLERDPPRDLFIAGTICRLWFRGQPLICNICSERGHKAAVCPNKGACFRCKQKGHFARECRNAWGTAPQEPPPAAPVAVVEEEPVAPPAAFSGVEERPEVERLVTTQDLAGESWADDAAPEFSVAPSAVVLPAVAASVHLTAEDVSSSPSTAPSESCSQSVLPAPPPQSQGSSLSSSSMECVSVDNSPIPWTVVTNRRKRTKAPLEFCADVVNSKDKGKKARVVVNSVNNVDNVNSAGASGNIKEKKKEQKNCNVGNSSMFGPGSPGDSTLAEGALSAPESSSRDLPSSFEVEMVPASQDSYMEDGQIVNTPLPGVTCMPPPATPSPKSSYSRSVTRSPSPSVHSPRGRSPSTGRRPAVRPEPNLPQTTRRSRSNLPIPSGKKS